MPKIPVYERKQSIPGESANVMMPVNAGPVGEGLVKIGQAGMDLSSAINHYEIVQQRAEDYNQAQNLKIQIESDAEELRNKYNDMASWQDIDKTKDTDLKAFRDKYSNIDNPRIAARVGLYAEQHAIAAARGIRKVRTELFTQGALADLENRLDSCASKAYFAKDPVEQARLRESCIQDVDGAIESKVIKANVGEKIKRGLNERIDSLALQTFLNSSDKNTLQEVIDNIQNENFLPHLKPEVRVQAAIHARDKQRQLSAQFEADQNRYQNETRYKLYDLLDNPKVPAASKIAYIDKLTLPDAQTGFRGLDAREAYSLKEHLRKGGGTGEGGGKTNFGEWLRLYNKAKDGDLESGDILNAVKNGLISVSDAKNLSAGIVKRDNAALTAGHKEALKLVDTSMKQFGNLLKTTFDTRDPDDKKLIGLVLYDVQQVAESVTDKKDLPWLEDYQRRQLDYATQAKQSEAIKKLTERIQTPDYYKNMITESSGKKAQSPQSKQTAASQPPVKAQQNKIYMGTKNGQPVYNLGGGRWQIGD